MTQLKRSGDGALSQTDRSLAVGPMQTKAHLFEASFDLNTSLQVTLRERPQV